MSCSSLKFHGFRDKGSPRKQILFHFVGPRELRLKKRSFHASLDHLKSSYEDQTSCGKLMHAGSIVWSPWLDFLGSSETSNLKIFRNISSFALCAVHRFGCNGRYSERITEHEFRRRDDKTSSSSPVTKNISCYRNISRNRLASHHAGYRSLYHPHHSLRLLVLHGSIS